MCKKKICFFGCERVWVHQTFKPQGLKRVLNEIMLGITTEKGKLPSKIRKCLPNGDTN